MYCELTDRRVFNKAATYRLVVQTSAICVDPHTYVILGASCYTCCGSVVGRVEGTHVELYRYLLHHRNLFISLLFSWILFAYTIPLPVSLTPVNEPTFLCRPSCWSLKPIPAPLLSCFAFSLCFQFSLWSIVKWEHRNSFTGVRAKA